MKLDQGAVRAAAKSVDKWLAYQSLLRRIPGLSIGIVFEGELTLRTGYGYADLRRRIPADGDTRYRIASISKLFTAVATLQLAERGDLRLGDRVVRYLPWFSGRPGLDRVSVRDLLTHRSGVARDGRTPHWATARFPKRPRMEGDARSGSPIFPPSRKFKYSNLGFALLGEVVEAAAGQPYEAVIRKQIRRPLSMTSTTVDLPASGVGVALGYGRMEIAQVRRQFDQVPTQAYAPATGFTSNVPDLGRLIDALTNGKHDLLADRSLRMLRRPSYFEADNQYGYGVGTQIWRMKGRRLFGHTGGFIGFSSRVVMDPASRLGVVLLSNCQDSALTTFTSSVWSTIGFFSKNQRRLHRGRAVDFRPFEGRYSNRSGEIEFISVRNRLVGVPLDTDRPADELMILEHDRRSEFRITTADPHSFEGERVKFVGPAGSHATRVYIGPSPHRFEGSLPRSRLRIRAGSVRHV